MLALRENAERCLSSWEKRKESRVQNGYWSPKTGSLHRKETEAGQVCGRGEVSAMGSPAGGKKGPILWKDLERLRPGGALTSPNAWRHHLPLAVLGRDPARAFLTQKHASSCRVDRARGDPSTRALLSPEAWHTSLLAPRIQASPRLVLSPKSLAKPEREPTLGQTPPRPRSFVQLLLTTPHTPSWVLRDPGEPGPWPGGGTGHSMHREAQSQQGHEGNLGASHRVSEAPGRV